MAHMSSASMKAAVTDDKGKLWLEKVPIPKPGAYQCLCAIEACATCSGTDQKHIAGTLSPGLVYPAVLGHESVGIVIHVGPGVLNLREGDRVLRPCAVYPLEKLGPWFSAWGGFAEFGLVTDRRALLEDHPGMTPNNYTRFQQTVPHDLKITAADATMLVTLKETASTVANAGVGLFTSAVILGAGAVGLGMCRFAKLFGASPVIVTARRDLPLDHAREIGADFTVNAVREDAVARIRALTDGRGVDRLIDTTGQADFLTTMLPILAEGGKVVPYATYAMPNAIAGAFPAERIISPAPREDEAHRYLLDAVRLGLVRPSDYYSLRLPLTRIVEAFDLLRRKEAFKVVLEML